MHQIVGFPQGQALAAVAGHIGPEVLPVGAHGVGQAQVGGEDIEPPVDPGAHNGEIPHALFAVVRPEKGTAVIHCFPVKAVPAQGEAELFAVGGGHFAEMDKEIRLLHGGGLVSAGCAAVFC